MNMLDSDSSIQSDEPLSIIAESNVSTIAVKNVQSPKCPYDEVTALLKNLELRRRQNRARIMVKGELIHRSTKNTTHGLNKITKNKQRSKAKSSA